MSIERDKFDEDYFLSPDEQYQRDRQDRLKRIEEEENEKRKQRQILEIQSKKEVSALWNPKEEKLNSDYEEYFEYEYEYYIPDERDEYAREHGFINQYDRNRFVEETRGMSFLQKMNHLVDNADVYGLTDNVYYLEGVSSEDYVQFADAIVWLCLYDNRNGKDHYSELPTYAVLKETLETIHDNMILDVQSIEEFLAQGKSRQWNTKRYKSADGVEFCVFNQLKTPNQRLRAIAFAICNRHWKLEVK